MLPLPSLFSRCRFTRPTAAGTPARAARLAGRFPSKPIDSRVMRAALATGALASPRGIGDAALFTAPDDAPGDTPALLGVQDHVCVFFDAEHGRLCAVQRALGHDALPLACRQFPRVSLRDPRGVSVTLSHYCPTAASLLGSPRPVTIVRDAPAFPEGAEYLRSRRDDGAAAAAAARRADGLGELVAVGELERGPARQRRRLTRGGAGASRCRRGRRRALAAGRGTARRRASATP